MRVLPIRIPPPLPLPLLLPRPPSPPLFSHIPFDRPPPPPPPPPPLLLTKNNRIAQANPSNSTSTMLFLLHHLDPPSIPSLDRPEPRIVSSPSPPPAPVDVQNRRRLHVLVIAKYYECLRIYDNHIFSPRLVRTMDAFWRRFIG